MSDIILSGIDDFDYESKIRRTGRNTEKQDKRVSVLKVIVLVLCVLLLFEALLYMLVIPCMAPVKLQITGLTTLSQKQMTSVLEGMGAKTWMQFDTSKAVSLVSSIPGVKDVVVDKRFPDRVMVRVTEREPVAQTIVTVDDHSMPVQIDENGVLFPSTAAGTITDMTVPLVTGLPVDRVENGMRIPEKYRTLMEQIATIRSLPQKYFAAISEIQVVPKEYGNYELVLYPIHSRVRVLTDRSLNEDALKYMMVVLDVVNSIEPDVSEIDLRYGSVSYRRR